MPHTAQIGAPKKVPAPKPTLSITLEELEGAGDLEHGDNVTLEAKGKVTEISTRNDYDNGGKTTHLVFELSNVKVSEKHLRTAPLVTDKSGGTSFTGALEEPS